MSSSTVLTVVLAVLKPSATSTRPSGRVPCACPARLPIIAGPALNVPPLMVKMWVAVVEDTTGVRAVGDQQLARAQGRDAAVVAAHRRCPPSRGWSNCSPPGRNAAAYQSS